ncbi:MAG TPA: hypothetical protein DDW68_10300, partial [Verrucomicrobiales bacterium]|nr:hypothetical protein [Verrucomicrobiales bacterium]
PNIIRAAKTRRDELDFIGYFKRGLAFFTNAAGRLLLLGICFWREDRGNRRLADTLGWCV